MPIDYTASSAEELQQIAFDYAQALQYEPQVVCLWGDMGAGKTTFTQGFIHGLTRGQVQKHNVTSPTYTIVQIYETPSFPIAHFDLYRIEDVSELYEIGIEEFLDNNYFCIFEWSEKLQRLLPQKRIDIYLKISEKDRKISIVSRN